MIKDIRPGHGLTVYVIITVMMTCFCCVSLGMPTVAGMIDGEGLSSSGGVSGYTEPVIRTAEAITNYGAMAVMAGVYLVISGLLMFSVFKWFKTLVDRILKEDKDKWKSVSEDISKQTAMLVQVFEAHKEETELRITNVSGLAFDLAMEQACHIVWTTHRLNHIEDKEAVLSKVRVAVSNIHEERLRKFNAFTYRGVRLSKYCEAGWVEQVTDMVMAEIYNPDGEDEERTRAAMKMLYQNIRMDFLTNIERA